MGIEVAPSPAPGHCPSQDLPKLCLGHDVHEDLPSNKEKVTVNPPCLEPMLTANKIFFLFLTGQVKVLSLKTVAKFF